MLPVMAVRVGSTVRRPSTSGSNFVAELLKHLESVQFDGAPKYLGQDEQRRDTFSYIPGWVPAKFQHFTDAQIPPVLRWLSDAGRFWPIAPP
jgi:hypothetical protein